MQGGHYTRFYCSGLYKQGVVICRVAIIPGFTVVAFISRGLLYTGWPLYQVLPFSCFQMIHDAGQLSGL